MMLQSRVSTTRQWKLSIQIFQYAVRNPILALVPAGQGRVRMVNGNSGRDRRHFEATQNSCKKKESSSSAAEPHSYAAEKSTPTTPNVQVRFKQSYLPYPFLLNDPNPKVPVLRIPNRPLNLSRAMATVDLAEPLSFGASNHARWARITLALSSKQRRPRGVMARHLDRAVRCHILA